MGEGDRSKSTDGTRERQRVLLLCAGIIVLFAVTDRMTLGYFAWRPLLVRLLWALFIVATALNLRGAGRERTRELMLALAVFSTAFYAALAALTGGVASPLFHWMLALPVAIAVVIADHPAAIVGSGLAMLAGGLGILTAADTSPALCWQWAGTAAIMVMLAAYISGSSGRLHAREAALRRAGAEANTRARASEAAIAAGRTPGHRRPRAAHPAHFAAAANRRRRARRLPLARRRPRRRRAAAHRLDRATGEPPLRPHRRDARHVAPDSRPAGVELRSNRSGGAGARGGAAFRPRRGGRLLRDEGRSSRIAGWPVGRGAPRPDCHQSDRQCREVRGRRRDRDREGRGTADVVQLIVRDHGIGISSEDQQRIFRRFERASGQRQHPGLGLGLWITSELCKARWKDLGHQRGGRGRRVHRHPARRSPTAIESQKPRMPDVEPSRV